MLPTRGIEPLIAASDRTDSGKTLILESIAGLMPITSGRIRIGGPVDPACRFMPLRPEDIRIYNASIRLKEGASNRFIGLVTRIDHQGVFCDVWVRSNGLLWHAILPTGRLMEENIALSCEVWLQVPPEKIHVMTGADGSGHPDETRCILTPP